MKLNPKTTPASSPVALRRLAKTRLQVTTAACPPRTEDDLRRLQQELEVHQLELELQNEELKQAKTQMETLLDQYATYYDFAPVAYYNLHREGMILTGNLAGGRLLGVERSRLVNRPFGQFDQLAREALGDFQADTAARKIAWKINPLPAVRADRALLGLMLVNPISNAVKFTSHRATAKIEIGEVKPAGGNLENRKKPPLSALPQDKTVIYIRDNGAGLDRLILELRNALAEVKRLSSLPPICARCKKIRDDRNQWQPVEVFIRDHSEAQFTHSLCPDCVKRFFQFPDREDKLRD